MRFFRDNYLAYCSEMISDPGKINQRFVADTRWLAHMMCGTSDSQLSSHEADEIVIKVHLSLGKEFKTVKAYKIDRCSELTSITEVKSC